MDGCQVAMQLVCDQMFQRVQGHDHESKQEFHTEWNEYKDEWLDKIMQLNYDHKKFV